MPSVLLFFLMVSVLFGCVTSSHDLSYTVSVAEPQRVHFSGKGAAAGMMMSSSMGPVGIAIGVAIDEGIAREINESLNEAGCLLSSVADSAFQQAAESHGFTAIAAGSPSASSSDHLAVEIKRIEFKAVSGSDDLVNIVVQGHAGYLGALHDPKITGDGDPVEPVSLADMRTDGLQACEAVSAALEMVFDGWIKSVLVNERR